MKLTHTGRMTGYGSYSHVPDYLVKLRQTAKFWITQDGIKYRKTDGSRVGAWSYSGFMLALESIVEHVENPYAPR